MKINLGLNAFILIITVTLSGFSHGDSRSIQNKIKKVGVALSSLTTAVILSFPVVCHSKSLEEGKAIFETRCAGCHQGGGNIIPFSGSKTLDEKALTKNGYNSVEDILKILQSGKGAMMPYGEFTSPAGNLIPASLSSNDMENVAEYVLEQAAAGWK